MKKNIFIKFITCLVLISLFFIVFYSKSSYAIGDIVEQGTMFLGKGNDIGETINETALKDASSTIYKTLFAIGVVVAIIIAMVLGIKFMWASAEEKAKVKESIMPFVIGCFVVFGSFTIWKMAVNIGNEPESESKNLGQCDSKYDIDNNGIVDSRDEEGLRYLANMAEKLIVNPDYKYLVENSKKHSDCLCAIDYNKDGVYDWKDFDSRSTPVEGQTPWLDNVNLTDVALFRNMAAEIKTFTDSGCYKTTTIKDGALGFEWKSTKWWGEFMRTNFNSPDFAWYLSDNDGVHSYEDVHREHIDIMNR